VGFDLGDRTGKDTVHGRPLEALAGVGFTRENSAGRTPLLLRGPRTSPGVR
jgi:hypothetical protein